MLSKVSTLTLFLTVLLLVNYSFSARVSVDASDMSFETLNVVKDALEQMVDESLPNSLILQRLTNRLYAVDNTRDWFLVFQDMASVNTTNIEYVNFLFDRGNTELLVLGLPRC